MPDPFINVPMLPKKHIMRWNLPSISTIFIDFALIISVAFNYNGLSKVKTGVSIFKRFVWSITKLIVEYIQDIFDGSRSIIGGRFTVDFPGYFPTQTLAIYPDQPSLSIFFRNIAVCHKKFRAKFSGSQKDENSSADALNTNFDNPDSSGGLLSSHSNVGNFLTLDRTHLLVAN